ncbi:hypothetical protein [Streptacidiphilus rugosus]|uniref:hypothetical protein n=1 Tax=Streptacidiphilus rugosus TaxID=405783 RepID=UPI000568A6DC|nr:hypothetical protein [Streptacidiphilus rugosus]
MRLVARTSFFRHAEWIDLLGVLVLLGACCLPGRFFSVRWILGVLCLLAVLVLQRSELDQQALHTHGRVEHVTVLGIGEISDGMSGGSTEVYTVSVLDGPPLDPVRGGAPGAWHWAVGGTYEVTVDPRGLASAERGGVPGPPVLQQACQVPLVLALAGALWRPAQRRLHRCRSAERGLEGLMR